MMATKHSSKAQASIGLLILFIATLFVGAIAAGVFITSNNEFQAKATSTGDQARKDVSTMFFTMDIVASDGTDGDLEYFRQIVKIPPGMDPIDMAYVTLVFTTEDVTATLSYRGVGSTTNLGSDGYNTFLEEELGALGDYYDQLNQAAPSIDGSPRIALTVDLDDDGAVDQAVVCDSAFAFCPPAYDGDYLQFHLSTAGDVYVPFITTTGAPLDVSTKNGQIFGNYLSPIGDYGYVTITGSENAAVGAYTILGTAIRVYKQPTILTEDLDDDGSDDSLVINDTHVILHYSSKGDIAQQLNLTRGVAYPLGFNLGAGAQPVQATITLQDDESTEVFGTIEIDGATTRDSFIDEDVTFNVIPNKLNKGYYTFSYVQQSPEYQEGVLNQGDIIRLYYEAPRPIVEDEEIHILLLPKNGVPTHINFFMPNIIAAPSVAVYPS